MTHKAGFVAIIGYPNAGKSTLMNALVGEKLAIISPKVQTTRHRIKGFVNGEDYQVVFSDTPGILDPKYKLQHAMLAAIYASLADADCILLITVAGERFMHQAVLDKILGSKVPVIVLINKIDLSNQAKVENSYSEWQRTLPGATIMPVSAMLGINLDLVKETIIDLLPESPAFFPKEEMTEHPERFFVSEIIREKILLQYSEEIPYSCEVSVESFREEEMLTRISATIFVSRESQKGIILGHMGRAIKRLGMTARKDIEAFLGRHIFLELHVKIARDWRENDRMLKRFGYTIQEENATE